MTDKEIIGWLETIQRIKDNIGKLNRWEKTFIDDVNIFLLRNKTLTLKQQETISRIDWDIFEKEKKRKLSNRAKGMAKAKRRLEQPKTSMRQPPKSTEFYNGLEPPWEK